MGLSLLDEAALWAELPTLLGDAGEVARFKMDWDVGTFRNQCREDILQWLLTIAQHPFGRASDSARLIVSQLGAYGWSEVQSEAEQILGLKCL